MEKTIEIDEELLRKKIENIDSSLDFKKAKELIEKVKQELGHIKSMSTKRYKSIVNRCKRILKLSSYNYCRIAFAYLRSEKKVQKDTSNKSLQTTFPSHLAIG